MNEICSPSLKFIYKGEYVFCILAVLTNILTDSDSHQVCFIAQTWLDIMYYGEEIGGRAGSHKAS